MQLRISAHAHVRAHPPTHECSLERTCVREGGPACISTDLVVVEVIFVAFQRVCDPKGVAGVRVDVIVVVVVVTAKVVLHAVTAVDQEIVVGVVEARAIVVVHVFLWAVVVDEEVVVDLAPLHDHVWFPRTW